MTIEVTLIVLAYFLKAKEPLEYLARLLQLEYYHYCAFAGGHKFKNQEHRLPHLFGRRFSLTTS